MLNVIVNGPVTAEDAARLELGHILDLPATDTDELAVDVYPRTSSVTTAFVAARGGGNVAVAITSTMPEIEFARTYLYFNVVVSDEESFDDLTASVFLPLLQNLMVGGPDSGDDDDDDDDDDK